MADLDDRADDLFGEDGSDESLIAENPPLLSDDEELASGSDRPFSTFDTAATSGVGESEHREKTVSEEVIVRHGLPKSDDGNMQATKVPSFLMFLPNEYDRNTHQPSGWDMQNSARKIPTSVIRYRRNPKTGKMESNANIFRWSDGSLTIQVGDEHFDIQVKEQVPPADKPYIPDRDAHRYVAAAHVGHSHLMTVAHINEEWTIRPDKKRVDEDMELLRQKMGLAKGGLKEGDMIITATEDPELQKKKAEQAEKERVRAQRRRDNAQARMDGGGVGGLGLRRGGLHVGELEIARRAGGRKRGPGGSSRRNGGGRRNDDEYDSDDDLPAGARGHANEYEREDSFIASSDDGMESGEGEEDEEEDILDAVDRQEHERPRAKRPRTGEPSDEDGDADGEPEEAAPAGTTAGGEHARRRKRRIVDDDDSE